MDPVVITALDQEGRGIARVDGKAIFVEGALIGERVAIEVFQRKPHYEKARAIEILTASAARAVPRCPHFGVCGGISQRDRQLRHGVHRGAGGAAGALQ
jgi:23S rRNA (uracil1939-C5)-methyltransferase